jgi:hypothetical protein
MVSSRMLRRVAFVKTTRATRRNIPEDFFIVTAVKTSNLT